MERIYELQEYLNAFFSFYGFMKHFDLIALDLYIYVSNLSRLASVSYAGSSGSDNLSRIHAFLLSHFSTGK